MRQIIIFAVPQGHTQEAVLTNPTLSQFTDGMVDLYDAKWPGQQSIQDGEEPEHWKNWWMPGFSRKFAGKTAVMMNVNTDATVENIEELMSATPINWLIIGMYDRHLQLVGSPPLADGGWKKNLDKTDLLNYKNDEYVGEPPVAQRPTALGFLPMWYGDNKVEGDLAP